MKDSDKSRQELAAELDELREQVAALKGEYRLGERARLQSEIMLESIVKSVPDVIYRVDGQGKIVFISDAIRGYGYSPEALVGTNIFDLVHPDDRERATYRINEKRTGERRTKALELRLVTKSETAVPFEFKSSSSEVDPTLVVNAEGVYASEAPEPDTFLFTQGVARDVTERKWAEQMLAEARNQLEKRVEERTADLRSSNQRLQSEIAERRQAEEALRESEERYRSLVEELPVGIAHFSPEGRAVYFNPHARDLLGYSSEELPSLRVEELFLTPADQDELLRHLDEKGEHAYECRMRRKDGRVIWARGATRAVKDSDGEVLWYQGSLEDVTARRRMQEEKQRLEEQLRQAQKMEAVGELTAGIAHNFNNMLQGVITTLDLVMRDVPAPLLPFLAEAHAAARQSGEMIQQLMVYSHQGTQPEHKPVEIPPLVGETVAMCRKTFDRKIDLAVETPAELPEVPGDRGQLEQVLLNLYLNARDALQDVAGRIPAIKTQIESVELGEGQVGFPGVAPGAYVRIRVTDNGAGMDGDTRQRVFEPFFTTKEQGKGTGLGLSTVFGIVRQHRGWIECDSSEGQGSTFAVYLPALASPQGRAVQSGKEPVPGGTETLLVIEDEEMVRRSVAALLERWGYVVLTAADGREGLEVFQHQREEISLVLLDLSMPRMSGQEVLAELRTVAPELKVMVMTGYSASDELLTGAADIVEKPIAATILARKVRDVLDA